jgi:hypothetical protein
MNTRVEIEGGQPEHQGKLHQLVDRVEIAVFNVTLYALDKILGAPIDPEEPQAPNTLQE